MNITAVSQVSSQIIMEDLPAIIGRKTSMEDLPAIIGKKTSMEDLPAIIGSVNTGAAQGNQVRMSI